MKVYKFLASFTVIVLFVSLFFNTNVHAIINRYFEDTFEVSVPGLPSKYSNVFCNLEDVSVEIKEDKIVILNLVPDQVYHNVEITFTDDIGRKYEFNFDNVITSLPKKANNKFVYDAYLNGLGRKPDHTGFKYWFGRLSSGTITAVDFINEMVSSDEFNSNYSMSIEKIKALYKTVVGREADEEGLGFWLSEFNILVEQNGIKSSNAILELVKRMVSENEFISIVEEAGFIYN
ncbi:DUF4214 domain-containing protein [Candidatus Arthromitus sp. SFB-rat-Yit]|uniref:DUF4214 domain-containing protein n=1 Tax=Candidatus Arthromitus sp. SFB-rat-Yit TaxID=1041504 RepID=UPI000227A476|nr:DUF4214 domain-containing protein [Candidatus Arthromitus sp. SFB-rat-Yit]BAK80953.1 hypothetical protein RATSFB_0391 [Candidatus Arthromitus sp. SFB-rat-Yit]